jgi:hypothetical protein
MNTTPISWIEEGLPVCNCSACNHEIPPLVGYVVTCEKCDHIQIINMTACPQELNIQHQEYIDRWVRDKWSGNTMVLYAAHVMDDNQPPYCPKCGMGPKNEDRCRHCEWLIWTIEMRRKS